MEHSDIVTALEDTFMELAQQGRHRISAKDIAERVLAEHPELDGVRVLKAGEKVLGRLCRSESDEEREAYFAQVKRHAATLPQEEAIAYLKREAQKARLRAELARQHAEALEAEGGSDTAA